MFCRDVFEDSIFEAKATKILSSRYLQCRGQSWRTPSLMFCMQQATTRTQTTRTTTHQQQQHQQQQQQQAAAAAAAASSSRQVSSGSSQLFLSTGDDDKVVLTGTGLQTARVNEHAEFNIDGTNAGYGQSLCA